MSQQKNSPALAARLGRIRPSSTIAVSTRAKELKDQGKDIINLGTGEPDFDTPEHIKQAARKAIDAGETKYTAVPGTLALRESICRKLARDNSLAYEPAQIVVTNGAKHAIMNLVMCVVDHGDEVVIPAPCWVSYPDMTSFCGGVPVVVRATVGADYKVTADQLRDAMSDKTALVMLNSPNNPSGTVYTRAEFEAIGAVVAEYPSAIVCTDDIYEHVVYGDAEAVSFATACPDLLDRTVVVNGVSKAYAMTGWRLGFSASTPELAKAMSKVQSQSTSNVCTISQAAATAAFDSDLECLKPMLEAFSARRSRVIDAFSQIDGLQLAPIDGAFYAFPQADSVIARLHDQGTIAEATDTALCSLLLDSGVAAVPGSAFEAPGSFRISFAAEDGLVDSALERIAKALA